MHIDYLREFVELAYSLNYTKAAARLGTSQSSISKHIQALEAEYGMGIISRDSATLALTPFGRELFQEASSLLATCDHFERRMKRISESFMHSVRIAGMYYNSRVVDAVNTARRHAQADGVDLPISYKAVLGSSVIDSLLEDEVDVAIVPRCASLEKAETLSLVDLFDEPLYALVSSAHPLASRETLSVSELAEWTAVKPAGSYTIFGNEAVGAVLRENGVKRSERFVFLTSIQEIFTVDLGEGISVIEESLVRSTQCGKAYKALKLEGKDTFFRICAAFRAERTETEQFARMLAEASAGLKAGAE